MSESAAQVHSREDWQRELDAWRESGLTQSGYCRQRGISFHRFRYWKGKFEGRRKAVGMVRVPVELNAPQEVLEVLCGAYTIRVPVGFDEGTLKRLLAVVGNQQ